MILDDVDEVRKLICRDKLSLSPRPLCLYLFVGIWFYNVSCSLPFVFGTSKAVPLAALSVANHPKRNPATFVFENFASGMRTILVKFVLVFVLVRSIVLTISPGC